MYEPLARQRDRMIERDLGARDVAVKTFNASLLGEPDSIMTGSGTPYRVFTAFWKAISHQG